MILYVFAKTTMADAVIDYIEVKLSSGEEVSLNWDESYIAREKHGFSARYVGTRFGEDSAEGRIAEMKGLKILEVQVYSESFGGELLFDGNDVKREDFFIESMLVLEGMESLPIRFISKKQKSTQGGS